MTPHKIYKITHKDSGLSYIGLTKRSLSRRWYEHQWVAKTRPITPLHRAIAKYGEDAFMMSVLEVGRGREWADQKEKEYIQIFNTQACGYNLTEGGTCVAVKGPSHIASGRKQTAEHRGKISKKHLGRPKPFNSSIRNQGFVPWCYISRSGFKVICTHITKREWCRSNGCGIDSVKASIRYQRPVMGGSYEGYQFFNGTDFGAAEGIISRATEGRAKQK